MKGGWRVHGLEFGAVAERWVRRRPGEDSDDPPFAVDEQGFRSSHAAHDEVWLRLDEAGTCGGWVLLGEPGSGKTTAFKSLIPDHTESAPLLPGGPGTVVWVNGSDLADSASTQEVLGVHLDALPEAADAAPVPVDVVVIIDQLDESPYLTHFRGWLKRKLATRYTEHLRIWIACRTAEYPTALTRILEDSLGCCVVGDLAPLSREDAAGLVASTGTDAEVFLKAVVDNAAGGLASVPLTLKVLLAAYRQDADSLRGGPRRWFELGLAALADEHDRDRISQFEHTTVEQRLAIARRIAAHLVLSGRRTLDKGWAGNQTDRAVPMGAVIGQHESAGAGKFEVTKPMVEETLATALFSHTEVTATLAHSSFAAVLTAQYLAERLTTPTPIPTQQLAGLFLVSAPDEDTAAIPEHLRETAAWLLALAPGQAQWLAEADPESLVGYSAVITDGQTRARLVDGLLQRADRIELVDRSWQRVRWHLNHTVLAEQLGAVLTAAADNPTENWVDHARTQLAVRLAQDSGLADLAEPLLQVVDSDWPVGLRQSAVKAAMNASPAIAAPRLRTLLGTLTPATVDSVPDGQNTAEQPEWDNITELVGTLLQVLWPKYLPFTEALPHIRPVTTRHFLGMYKLQVRQFPELVAEPDLPALLTHTEVILRARGVVLDPADSDLTDAGNLGHPGLTTAGVYLHGTDFARNLRDFVAPVIERILMSSQADEHLPRIARILLWFLPSSERMPLPAAVDLVDVNGTEPESTAALRRRLTEDLIRVALAASSPTHHVYWVNTVAFSLWGQALPYSGDTLPPGTHRGNRRQLLDAGDADWATTRALDHATSEPVLAEGFTRLASALTDTASLIVAEPASNEVIDPEWALADEYATQQRQRLDQAEAGDTAAFLLLVRDLTANPTTGHYEMVTSWDLSAYPGAALWPEDELRERLRVAAQYYLFGEDDHHETWLGTGEAPWLAYAGYFALANLHATDQDADGASPGLAPVPDERWAAWVGAIVHFNGTVGTHGDLGRDLLDHAAQHAPTQLAAAVQQYVRTHLAYATTPLYLPDFPAVLSPFLAALAVELHTALQTAPQETASDAAPAEKAVTTEGPLTLAPTLAVGDAVITWTHLLRQPVQIADATAVDLAREAIASHTDPPDSEISLKLAVAAGYILLTADAEQHWDTIHDRVSSSAEFAQDLALACAGDENDTRAITDPLPEAALAQLYDWLATVCPPETEIIKPGFGFISPERRIHDWRRNTVSTLAGHGTTEAVHQLRRLADAHPERLDLGAALIDARRRAQAAATQHLAPDQVTALLNDHSRRVVHTPAQLAKVIIDTLDLIQADLHTHSNLLWDCERAPLPKKAPKGTRRRKVWRPKSEGALSTYLAHELKLRLEHRSIVVNREVVISPTDEGDSGERDDIQVDASTPDDQHVREPIISLPIEVKGAWHEDAQDAQDTQLAKQYMSDLNTSAGVYVVGWYPLHHWDAPASSDKRKTDAKSHGTRETLIAYLEQQAVAIDHPVPGGRTYPYVLTVPRQVPRKAR